MFMRSYGGQFFIFCPMCGCSITFIFILTAQLAKTSKFISVVIYMTIVSPMKLGNPSPHCYTIGIPNLQFKNIVCLVFFFNH